MISQNLKFLNKGGLNMEHTKGKIVGGYYSGISDGISAVLRNKETKRILFKAYTDTFSSHSESHANTERAEALWNAADGMTTEEAVIALNCAKEVNKIINGIVFNDKMSYQEAVKYLEHGREMVERLKMHCNLCKLTWHSTNEGIPWCQEDDPEGCPTQDLLAKLEDK
jgi:hypothetical protein